MPHTDATLATISLVNVEDADAEQRALDNIKLLKEKWAATITEREFWSTLLGWAEGDQVDFVPPLHGESDQHWLEKPRYAPNLVGAAVRKLSYLYNIEPNRTMLAGETEQKWASEKIWNFDCGLSAVLDEAMDSVRLTAMSMAYGFYVPDQTVSTFATSWRNVETNSDEDGIAFLEVTRDHFVHLADRDDARKVDSILVFVQTQIRDSGRDDKTHAVEVFHYWDDQFFAVLEHRTSSGAVSGSWQIMLLDGQEFAEHGYGVAPFVPLTTKVTSTRIPNWGLGGRDLIPNAEALSRLWTEMIHSALLSRGQPWVKGEVEGPLFLAPDGWLHLAGDANSAAGILTPGANLNGILSVLVAAMDAFALSLGVPSDTFKLSRREVQSGIAILAERAELQDDRKKISRAALKWERDLHRLAAKIYNASRGTTFIGKVDVQFREAAPVLTSEQNLAKATALFDRGLADDEDIIREVNPDLSEKVILDKVNRVQARREREQGEATATADADADRQAGVARASSPFGALGLAG